MIEIQRRTTMAMPVIKVVGVGGAGCRMVDRLRAHGHDGMQVVALNTDTHALSECSVPVKLQIGTALTMGLGTGGDIEKGYKAANDASADIQNVMQGADLVFLCVGLGGGTGSGAAPVVANIARVARAWVIAVVTLPFGFEGPARRSDALQALTQLAGQANILITFENDSIKTLTEAPVEWATAFDLADETLAGTVRALGTMLQRRGLLPAGLDELQSVMRDRDARCLFGYGEARGSARAAQAVAAALRHPLLRDGTSLPSRHRVLVHIAAGDDARLHEVETAMEILLKHLDPDAKICLGFASDPRLEDRFSVTILSSVDVAGDPAASGPGRSVRLPEVHGPDESPTPRKRGKRPEQMTFLTATRGWFNEAEPTIEGNRDLDIPTFLRMNIRFKENDSNS
jgi:cell division protein FtsZ